MTLKFALEQSPFDPYAKLTDPSERNQYREALVEAIREAREQWDIIIARATRGEITYSEAAQNARRRHDETIAECKRRYLEHIYDPSQPTTIPA